MMIDNYETIPPRALPDGSSEISSIQTKTNPLSLALKHLDRLTINFKTLINDEDGQSLFEEFTKLNKIYDYLLFWFAIEGFKRRFNELDNKSKKDKNFQNEITIMAKAIYNNFIKNNAKCKVYQWFSKSTRESIYNKIADNKFDSNIFNEVKNEFELRIQNEIFPKFLKSEIYLNYAENLKLNYQQSKIITKLNYNKNPYHKSITNYHPTSTQESECHFDLKNNDMIINQNDNIINLNENLIVNGKIINCNTTKSNSINIKLNDNNNQKNQIHKQQQLNNLKKQDELNVSGDNKLIDNDTNVTEQTTLQDLYATGARSNLPSRPDEDPQKVKQFIDKLERLYQDVKKKKFDNVIKKLNVNEEKLKSLINNKEKVQSDSQLILDQHCKMVFDSNFHSNGINSPHDDQLIKLSSSKTKNPKRIINQPDNRLLIRSTISNCNDNNYNYGYGILNDSIITSNNINNDSSSFLNTNNNRSKPTITIIYKYSTDNFSYTIKSDKKEITLKEFKKIIFKKTINYNNEKFRYFFKKKDQLDNYTSFIMEELQDENELVPLFDDKKIFSRIEIVSR